MVAFTIVLDNEFERRFRDAGGGARVASLTMWSNLLRFVGDGITVDELVAAVGLPRRRVLSAIGGVERWRYVSVGSSAGTRERYGSSSGIRRDWVVQLTPAGRRAAEIWSALPGEIEARWRKRFGADKIDELVGALRAVDERIDVELPEYLPIVSSTGGFALELGHLERRHVGERPLVSLLARALMAYMLDFQEGSPLPLPLSANVFRVLGARRAGTRDPLAHRNLEGGRCGVADIPRETEYVVMNGAPASKRAVRLAPASETLRADQRRLHARIRHRWETPATGLEHILDHPKLSAGLAPAPDGWRASGPYARQTQALLANPRGLLPHCPMVLPRGGWPDGS